ncbi:MAG: BlaI/MecI/CopY family transcriptional regulator [Lachnospiraceae bacterium]
MKNNGLMTQKEEDLMEFLWKQATPLTITEMAGIGQEEWNQVTLFRIVKGLLNKGYLKIHGFEKNNTQYARSFIPSLTKEEYAAILLSERGIKSSSLGSIALAMLGAGKRKKINQDEEDKLIGELENIIEQIRRQGD